MDNEIQQIEIFDTEDIVVFEPSKMLNVPSSTIHIENKISLIQKKLWFELIYHAFPKMGTQRKYSITLKRLRELLGWNDSTSNDTELKEALKGLNQTTVNWNIFGKDDKNTWQCFPLLAGCEIPKNSGLCIFSLSPFLEDRFLAMGEEAYVKIDLIISKKFQSKYALSIYCLALDYLMLEIGYSEKKFSIEELRMYLALKEGEYKFTANLNDRIIKPSEKEINDSSDMNIEIKPFKDGKKIAGYKLCMSLKEGRAKEYLDKKNKLKEIALNKDGKKIAGYKLCMSLKEGRAKEYLDKKNKLKEIALNTDLLKPPTIEPTKIIQKSKIIIKNEILKKFYSENKISTITDTVQERLVNIKTDLNNDLEDYLLFLMNYSKKEYNKGSIKNLAGFYVGLLKDSVQIDNYIFYKEEKKQKELNKETLINKHLKIELEAKYETYLSNNFQDYISSNIDKLENKITEFVINNITSGTFAFEAIIQRKMSGSFSIEKYKSLPNSYQIAIINELKNNQAYFGYYTVTYTEWHTKYVNDEYINLIKSELLSKKFS